MVLRDPRIRTGNQGMIRAHDGLPGEVFTRGLRFGESIP
jgi:hypothetical protein